MHIVWDQVPRWRKQANDGGGGGEKKSASEAGETADWGRLLNPQIG